MNYACGEWKGSENRETKKGKVRGRKIREKRKATWRTFVKWHELWRTWQAQSQCC
jgi:hypothetical protein